MESILNWLIEIFGFENVKNFVGGLIILLLFGILAGLYWVADKSSKIKPSGINFLISFLLSFIFSIVIQFSLMAIIVIWLEELSFITEYIGPYLMAIIGPLSFSFCSLTISRNHNLWVYAASNSIYFLLALLLWSIAMIGIEYLDTETIVITGFRLLITIISPFIVYKYKEEFL